MHEPSSKNRNSRSTRHLLSGLAASIRNNEYVVFISNHHRAEEFPFVLSTPGLCVRCGMDERSCGVETTCKEAIRNVWT